MISSRDILAFNEALLQLYAPGLELENYSRRAFGFLDRFFDSEVMVLASRDVPGGILTSTADRPLPQFDWACRVYAQFGPSQPFSSYDPSVNDGKPVSRSDYCSRRQYRDLPLYTELFRRYGFINRLVIPILAQSGRSVFISISRGGRDFSYRERRLAELAQAHLTASRHLAATLSAAKPHLMTPAMLVEYGFTPRESDVLFWLTEGKSNLEIATILHMRLPTVKGHLMSIFNKTGVSNRLAATIHTAELVRRSCPKQSTDLANLSSLTVPFGSPPTKVG